MEVVQRFFISVFFLADICQDLSLAPSDSSAASPRSQNLPNAGPSAGDSVINSALPDCEDSAQDSATSDQTPCPALPAPGDAAVVLSPAAPMSLFSPSVGPEAFTSPAAASSYAEAAEALGHEDSETSGLATPLVCSASSVNQQSDSHSAEPEVPQLDDTLGESGDSAH
jgi:hypothetical protein